MYRMELLLESAKALSGVQGNRVTRRRFGGAYITDIRVNAEEAEVLGRSAGRYITIEGEPCDRALKVVLQKAIELFLPRRGTVLVAGLGNPDIARDSLGAESVSRMTAFDGKRKALYVMETDIAAKTGIDTARMVKAVAKEVAATCVLVIDALACGDPLKIGKTVQITNTGICPGSGVDIAQPPITEEYVGVPVIAMGVPSVSELSVITGYPQHKGYLVAPPDEDLRTRIWAEVIAGAVNMIYI